MGWNLGRVTGRRRRSVTTVEADSTRAPMKQPLNRPLLCRRADRAVLAICGLFLAFVSQTAFALDPHRLISQYAHTFWRVQDGFPRTPSVITQTTDGYIWIGVGGGLV